MVRLRAGRRHQQDERERAITPGEALPAPIRRRILLIGLACEERAAGHSCRRRAAADGSPAWPVALGWPLTRFAPGQPWHHEGERSEPRPRSPAWPRAQGHHSPAWPVSGTSAILHDPFSLESHNIPYIGRSWRSTRPPSYDRRGSCACGWGIPGILPGAR